MYYIKSISGINYTVSALYSGESDMVLTRQECFDAVLHGNTILGVFPQQGIIKSIKTLFTDFFTARNISVVKIRNYIKVPLSNNSLGFQDIKDEGNMLCIDVTSLNNIKRLVELSGGI